MHLPDGLLNPATSATTMALSAGALAYAAYRVSGDLPRPKLSLAAAVGGCLFAAQMLNVPVTGDASGHLVGGVLAAVLLGPWVALLLMAAVLLVQCCLFADGGITAWGANVLNMAVLGCLLGAAARRGRREHRGLVLRSGVAAWLAVVAGAALASIELAYGSHTPVASYLAMMLPVHAVIGLGEGVVTGAVVALVVALRPALIAPAVAIDEEPQPATPATAPSLGRTSGAVVLCGAVALLLASGAAPFASTLPDGLEWSLERLGVTSGHAALVPAPMPDYRVAGLRPAWGTAAAGLVGVLAAGAVSGLLLGLPRKRTPLPAGATGEGG